ncbi:MAG: type II toxin-antitoxin system VapB family antitoxin [Candidatus Manganitrophaceae bacterium]
MHTTLNLDEDLMQELIKATEARTKTEAIHIAAAEMIRRKKLEKLKSLSGKIQFYLGWKEMEKIELREQKKRLRRIRGHH